MLKILGHFKGDTLWLYGSRFSAVMLQSLSMFVIAAFVSMEDFGRFSFMLSASRVVSVILGLGGASFLHRELPYRDEKYDGAGNCQLFYKTLSRTFLVTFIILLCSVLVYMSFFLAPEAKGNALLINKWMEFKEEFFLIILAGFLFSLLEMTIAVLRNARSATFSMMVNDCFPYLSFLIIFTVCLLLGYSSAETIMSAFSVSLFLCVLCAFVFSLSYLNKPNRLGNISDEQTGYLTYWGGSIMGTMLAQSDVLVGRFFLDNNDLGLYALMRRITNLVSLPQVIVNWLINVEVAKRFALDNVIALQESAKKGIVIAVPVALLISCGIAFTSPYWFILFDVELTHSAFTILFILMGGQLFNVLSGANLLFANQCREQLFVFKSRVLALITSLIAMPVCALHWGGIGLAFGSAMPIVILNWMVTYRVKRKIGVYTSACILLGGKK